MREVKGTYCACYTLCLLKLTETRESWESVPEGAMDMAGEGGTLQGIQLYGKIVAKNKKGDRYEERPLLDFINKEDL